MPGDFFMGHFGYAQCPFDYAQYPATFFMGHFGCAQCPFGYTQYTIFLIIIIL
jgi:hypothetical protein